MSDVPGRLSTSMLSRERSESNTKRSGATVGLFAFEWKGRPAKGLRVTAVRPSASLLLDTQSLLSLSLIRRPGRKREVRFLYRSTHRLRLRPRETTMQPSPIISLDDLIARPEQFLSSRASAPFRRCGATTLRLKWWSSTCDAVCFVHCGV